MAEFSIYVAERARGRGIGAALLKALIEESEPRRHLDAAVRNFPGKYGEPGTVPAIRISRGGDAGAGRQHGRALARCCPAGTAERRRRSLGGLLLRHAMQRSQAQHQIAAGNADHFAIREQSRQRVQGHAILRIAEGWRENQPVGDIEIGVARRKQAVRQSRPASGQGSVTTRRSRRCSQTRQIFFQRLVIGAGFIGLDHGDYGIGRGEARDVVDVAVSIVARDAAAQPDDFGGAQIIGQRALDLAPR